MRIPKVVLTGVATSLIILTGCGGGGSSSGGSGNGSDASSGASVPAACDTALSKLASGGDTNTDVEETAAQRTTLDACASRAEWLAGAEQYRGSGLNNVIIGDTKATDVLKAFCQGNSDAPACSG